MSISGLEPIMHLSDIFSIYIYGEGFTSRSLAYRPIRLPLTLNFMLFASTTWKMWPSYMKHLAFRTIFTKSFFVMFLFGIEYENLAGLLFTRAILYSIWSSRDLPRKK